MSPLFGGKKKTRRVPSQPPKPRSATPIYEIRKRFQKMKQRAAMYAVIGVILTASIGLSPMLVSQISSNLAIGLAIPVAIIFTYLSIVEAVNAYSYYLFARVREEIKSGAARPPQAAAIPIQPAPQPISTQPVSIQPTIPRSEVPQPIKAPPQLQRPEASRPVIPETSVQIPARETVAIRQPPVAIQPPPREKVLHEKPPGQKVVPKLELEPQPLAKQTPSVPSIVPRQQPASQQTGGKKKCPYCGRELPYGDLHVICPFCGRRLK